MVTGIQSSDLDFLVYKLLDGGSYFQDSGQKCLDVGSNVLESVEDMEGWFKELSV